MTGPASHPRVLLTDNGEGVTATPPTSTTRPPVIVTPTETAAPSAATAIATPEPTATTQPVDDACAPQRFAWVSIEDIDPETWVPPPLPVVCFPEDWELTTWRPDESLMPETSHRPWVLIDGRPIDGPPDAARIADLRDLLFSYDETKRSGAAATAAPGLDITFVRPWRTGRSLARSESIYAQMRTLWEDGRFSSRELTHHDEVVVVDLRNLDAYVYSFRRGYKDRWLNEYGRAITWARDDELDRALRDLPAFEALLPYHRFYMAVAAAEYRANEWPRHPFLTD